MNQIQELLSSYSFLLNEKLFFAGAIFVLLNIIIPLVHSVFNVKDKNVITFNKGVALVFSLFYIYLKQASSITDFCGYCIYYISVASIFTFILPAIDKYIAIINGNKTRKNKLYRISEAILLRQGYLGGILGLIAGMIIFSHKTKKDSFYIPAYTALVIYIPILGYTLSKFLEL